MPQNLTSWLYRNHRPRYGIRPRLIVLHTTEGVEHRGTADLWITRSVFNGGRYISAHVVIDQEGNALRMVGDDQVAYHAGWVNAWSLGIEQVGTAYTTRPNWMKYHQKQLYRVAAQIATWCIKYKIPFKKSRYRGICQHSDVSGRGGHWDCGPGYPIEYVILWAELIYLRRKGKSDSKRGRNLRYRIENAQKRYGIKHPDTKPW